jgi:phage gpG-like protein
MLMIDLAGADALDSRLDAFPAQLLDELAANSAILAAALVDKVRSDKLSGQVLNAVSGALRDSIVADIAVEREKVVASVGSAGDLKYAAIHEYGGKTAAHEILPSKASVLAFAVGGATIFARRVEHPGSVIPERSYLRSTLAEMMDEVVATLGQSPEQAWGRQ